MHYKAYLLAVAVITAHIAPCWAQDDEKPLTEKRAREIFPTLEQFQKLDAKVDKLLALQEEEAKQDEKLAKAVKKLGSGMKKTNAQLREVAATAARAEKKADENARWQREDAARRDRENAIRKEYDDKMFQLLLHKASQPAASTSNVNTNVNVVSAPQAPPPQPQPQWSCGPKQFGPVFSYVCPKTGRYCWQQEWVQLCTLAPRLPGAFCPPVASIPAAFAYNPCSHFGF